MSDFTFLFQKQRERHRLRAREEQAKIRRRQLQEGLMKNNKVYESYYQELHQALLKDQDYSCFLNILDDVLGQPIYLTGVVESRMLEFYLMILQHNNMDEEELGEEQSVGEEEVETPKSPYWIEEGKVAHQLNEKILFTFSKTFYNTSEGVKSLIDGIWSRLDSSQPIEAQLVLTTLTRIMRDLPQFHNIMLNKGIGKQLCQFIKQELITNTQNQSDEQDNAFISQKQRLVGDQGTLNPFNGVVLEAVFNHLCLVLKESKEQFKTEEEYWQQKLIVNQCFTCEECDYYLRLVIVNLLKSHHVQLSLELLSILVEYAPAYCDTLTQSILTRILLLLNSKDETLRKTTLQFIQTYTIYCSNSAIDTLHKLNILDALDQQLTLQNHLLLSPQNNTIAQSERISSLTYILCNLFTTKNQHVLHYYQTHMILDHISKYIQSEHPLIKVSRVFDFYFRSFEKWEGEKFRPVLDALIYAANGLDFGKESDRVIKDVIQAAFVRSQQKGDEEESGFIQNALTNIGIESVIEDCD